MPKKKETPQQKWAKKNRDKLAAACRRWRARHPERQKAATYRWRSKNLNKWNAYQRSWRRRNPELVQAATRKKWRKVKSDPARYAKHLAARRTWAAQHPEAIRRKSAIHRKNNLDKSRAYMRRWMKRWYHANLSEARKRRKAYRLSDLEKWRAYDRKIYRDKLRTNPKWRAHKKEQGRLWVKRNPEKQRHRVGRYRARKMAAMGSHSFEQWMIVVRAHSWRCFYCGKKLNRKTLTKDHCNPRSKGGSDLVRNLVPACKACNSGKAHRRKYRGRRER
jgi:hypothetical protein